MATRQNPLLASYEAKLERKYRAQLDLNSEIDLMAHLISCHEDLKVGPGRAEKVLNGFLESKLEIAETIIEESNEDPEKEIPKTQRDIAKYLKDIMGPENWKKYCHLFPLLKDHWYD